MAAKKASEVIDLCDSDEDGRPIKSVSDSFASNGTRSHATPASRKNGSTDASVSSPGKSRSVRLLTERNSAHASSSTRVSEAQNRDRTTFSMTSRSTISGTGSTTKQAQNKSELREGSMAGNSDLSNASTSQKRPRANDSSPIDHASKRPKTNEVKRSHLASSDLPSFAAINARETNARRSSTQGGTSPAKRNFIDLTAEDNMSPRRTGPSHMPANPRTSSIASTAPSSERAQDGASSQSTRKASVSERSKSQDQRRSSAFEIPESVPSTPTSESRATGSKMSSGSNPPASGTKLREKFSSAYKETPGSLAIKNTQSSPSGRKAQQIVASQPSHTVGPSRLAKHARDSIPSPTKTSAGSAPPSTLPVSSGVVAGKSPAGGKTSHAKQRTIPLSPSETSTEDNNRPAPKLSESNRRPSPSQSQKTPEGRSHSRVVEIPDSTEKSPENVNRGLEARGNVDTPIKHARSATTANDAVLKTVPSNQTHRAAEQNQRKEPSSRASQFKPGATAHSSPSKPRQQARPTKQVQSDTQSNADRARSRNGNITAMHPPITQQARARLHLSLGPSHRVERAVGRYVEEFRSDNEFWIQSMLRKARHSRGKVNDHSSTDVFANLVPVQVTPTSQKQATKGHAKFGVEMYDSNKKVKVKPAQWAAPLDRYHTDGADVPAYSQYVSTKTNFLAYNDTTLQHWPYFGDDYDEAQTALDAQYYLDVDLREAKLLRLAKAENISSYVEDMLRDAGCKWSDVLRFLLDPAPDIGTDRDGEATKALKRREAFCEDFTRASSRWTLVLSKLPEADPEKVGKAALLCDHFLKLTGLQLWHVARMSAYTKSLLKDDQNETTDNAGLTCRVCMRFNCPYHGEMREAVDDDLEVDDDEIAKIEHTDLINPQNVNFQSRVGFPDAITRDDDLEVPRERRSLKFWQTGINSSLMFKPDERGPFYPCDHPGESCNTARCSCFENRLPCEKSCSCLSSCIRKFQGCNCSHRRGKKGPRLICFENDDCACFQLGRECDPDLCGDCGVCDVLDPCQRDDDQVLLGNCRNANIQRGVPKHTIVGDSGVHGLGLYACEDIREHEFLGEYKGEIVTKQEADRRGAVYEHQKLSYLFSLNATQEIDSTHFGNKIRFINHAMKGKGNLYPRIQLVNTVHRIALYAARNIKAGDELFFDYGPMFPDEQLGGKTGKKVQRQSKATPHVRNSNMVHEFWDIEDVRDESGNLRARKATNAGADKPKYRKLGDNRSGGVQQEPASTAREDDEEEESSDEDEDDADIANDGDDSGEQVGAGDILRYYVRDDEEEEDDFVPADDQPESDEDFDYGPDEGVSEARRRTRSRRTGR